MATVFIRTAIIYFVFLLAVRFMGKRQVGELQLSELVTTFMLSNLAINPIQDISLPISYSIIPIIFLLSSEVITSFIIIKSRRLRKALLGTPSIIIKDGILDQKELQRLRISMSEFMSELRVKDVSDISDVQYAILEQNGKLSVFFKNEKQTATYSDVKGKSKIDAGIAHTVIIDGDINSSELAVAQKSEKWLDNTLNKNNLKQEDVFLLTVNDAGNIYIIRKEEK